MMKSIEKKYGVFISYSHEDRRFVAPLVKLIGAMRDDLVFQDTTDIKPGKKWEPQLISALDQAQMIIIFWCKHSAKSKYVQREYEKVILENKEILPVLLDDSKLNEELTPYQWIDFQNVISRQKNEIEPTQHLNHAKIRRFFIPIFTILFVVISAFILFIVRNSNHELTPNPLTLHYPQSLPTQVNKSDTLINHLPANKQISDSTVIRYNDGPNTLPNASPAPLRQILWFQL